MVAAHDLHRLTRTHLPHDLNDPFVRHIPFSFFFHGNLIGIRALLKNLFGARACFDADLDVHDGGHSASNLEVTN